MSSNIFFIVNPNSRSGKTKKMWEFLILPQVINLFPHFNWAYTNSIGDASLLAGFAKNKGYKTVVAVEKKPSYPASGISQLLANPKSKNNIIAIYGIVLNFCIIFFGYL
jgi:hypothetical protein